jgi:hypothetical protein
MVGWRVNAEKKNKKKEIKGKNLLNEDAERAPVDG